MEGDKEALMLRIQQLESEKKELAEQNQKLMRAADDGQDGPALSAEYLNEEVREKYMHFKSLVQDLGEDTMQAVMSETDQALCSVFSLTKNQVSDLSEIKKGLGKDIEIAREEMLKLQSTRAVIHKLSANISEQLDLVIDSVNERDFYAVQEFSNLIVEDANQLLETVPEVVKILQALKAKTKERQQQMKAGAQERKEQWEKLEKEIDQQIPFFHRLEESVLKVAGWTGHIALGAVCVAGAGLCVVGAGVIVAAPVIAGISIVSGQVSVGTVALYGAAWAGSSVVTGAAIEGGGRVVNGVATLHRQRLDRLKREEDELKQAIKKQAKDNKEKIEKKYEELDQNMAAGQEFIDKTIQVNKRVEEVAQHLKTTGTEMQRQSEQGIRFQERKLPSGQDLMAKKLKGHLESIRDSGLELPALADGLSTLAIVGDPAPCALLDHKLKVLVLDGGGMKSFISVKIVEQIEQQMGKPIHELFDIICGTYTGGLSAILLGVNKCSARDVSQLYEKDGGRMLCHGSNFKQIFAGSKCPAKGAEGIVREVVGDARMDAVENPSPKVFVTACQDDDVFLFRNYAQVPGTKKGMSACTVLEAALATCASPEYVPAVEVADPLTGEKQLFKDASLFANNPTNLALQEARMLWPGAGIGCVVSVGCGKAETLKLDTGLARFQTKEQPTIATSTEQIHNQVGRDVCEGSIEGVRDSPRYFRLNPLLQDGVDKDISLQRDSVNEESLTLLRRVAESFITSEAIAPIEHSSASASWPAAPLSSENCPLYHALRQSS